MRELSHGRRQPDHFAFLTAALIGAGMMPHGAAAQEVSPDIAALRQEVGALKAELARSAQRIEQLEAALGRLAAPTPSQTAPSQTTSSQAAPAAAALPPRAGQATAAAEPASPLPSRLTVGGDLRVRYESNFGDKDARNRDRGVLRARLRAAYAVNDWLTIGGQLVTGDPDDPNSSDTTLSGFFDDLDVSLDQAYARMTFGDLTVTAGKIPQPFVRTELVWDGDVNPQGVAATYRWPLAGDSSLRATAMYALVDEAAAGRDSSMIGAQIAADFRPAPQWRLELAAAYYDYRLGSTAGADAGDFRGNVVIDGAYVSDFDLLDVIGAVTYDGFGARWPVRMVVDYVHNVGARVPGDSGLGVDLFVGRSLHAGDFRLGYGYAEAGVDAVLAAFSQDNTSIATNYRQHTLLVDYMVTDNVALNVTFYRYKPKNGAFAGGNDPHDWLNRLRVNLLANF